MASCSGVTGTDFEFACFGGFWGGILDDSRSAMDGCTKKFVSFKWLNVNNTDDMVDYFHSKMEIMYVCWYRYIFHPTKYRLSRKLTEKCPLKICWLEDYGLFSLWNSSFSGDMFFWGGKGGEFWWGPLGWRLPSWVDMCHEAPSSQALLTCQQSMPGCILALWKCDSKGYAHANVTLPFKEKGLIS